MTAVRDGHALMLALAAALPAEAEDAAVSIPGCALSGPQTARGEEMVMAEGELASRVGDVNCLQK